MTRRRAEETGKAKLFLLGVLLLVVISSCAKCLVNKVRLEYISRMPSLLRATMILDYTMSVKYHEKSSPKLASVEPIQRGKTIACVSSGDR